MSDELAQSAAQLAVGPELDAAITDLLWTKPACVQPYSTTDEWSGKVLDWLTARGWGYEVRGAADGAVVRLRKEAESRAWRKDQPIPAHVEWTGGDTRAEAICRAALKTRNAIGQREASADAGERTGAMTRDTFVGDEFALIDALEKREAELEHALAKYQAREAAWLKRVESWTDARDWVLQLEHEVRLTYERFLRAHGWEHHCFGNPGSQWLWEREWEGKRWTYATSRDAFEAHGGMFHEEDEEGGEDAV